MVAAQVAAVDVACSRFRADSGLSAVNQGAGRPVVASGTLLDAVEVALAAAAATDGLVDPTIGRVLRVLGYDRDFELVAREGPPLRAVVTTVPGWRAVRVDRVAKTITVPEGVELDLGATAKAWCADRAAAAAAARCGTGVLVSLGGDIAVAGPSRRRLGRAPGRRARRAHRRTGTVRRHRRLAGWRRRASCGAAGSEAERSCTT